MALSQTLYYFYLLSYELSHNLSLFTRFNYRLFEYGYCVLEVFVYLLPDMLMRVLWVFHKQLLLKWHKVTQTQTHIFPPVDFSSHSPLTQRVALGKLLHLSFPIYKIIELEYIVLVFCGLTDETQLHSHKPTYSSTYRHTNSHVLEPATGRECPC